MKDTSLLRKVAKNITPPALPKLYEKLKYFKKTRVDFKTWWKAYKRNPNLPADLVLMVDYFVSSPAFANSSKYWNYLNMLNIQQIVDGGYDNFKQTVARNYFTFVGGGVETPYAQTLISEVGKYSSDIPVSAVLKKHDLFTMDESVAYNLITCLLYEFVSQNAPKELLANLEEPLRGNPPAITIRDKRISQDILNSTLEVSSILKGTDLKNCQNVIEVGAGSGRTSYAIMALFPHIKYVITDIPPALYISQNYLSEQFPNKKIFKFRPFKNFQEVEQEFFAADLRFITPDQLAILPEKCADVFLAIDCLHEMKVQQIQEYFDQADRLSKNIYYKCWDDTTIPFDNVRLRADSYPAKKNWRKSFQQQCRVPSTFFEAFFQIS